MHAIYMDDSYVKEFVAEVVSVKDDKYVTLSTTAFYPDGGGQPHDMGVLRSATGLEYSVVFVGKFSGSISHEVDKPGLKVGDKVTGVIDWPRRYKLMRSHTASHVISAVMHNEFNAKITGNQITEEKIRVDYNLESFDRGAIESAVQKTNQILCEDFPVSISYMDREKALADPTMVKLAGAMPPAVKELRIITIGAADDPVDRQADGGTHVHSTKEVGQLTLVKIDNKGKNNRRMYVSLTP